MGWSKVKYARITITHVCFIALTLAGSLRRCLNTRPIGLVFKQHPRDPANVNAWKNMYDPYIPSWCIEEVSFINLFQIPVTLSFYRVTTCISVWPKYFLLELELIRALSCADPESFVRVCPTLQLWCFFFFFFFFWGGGGVGVRDREDPLIPIKAGHQWPASKMPFQCCFAGVAAMMAQHWMLACLLWEFQGIRFSIAKKPYIFVIFKGGGRVHTPCPPSESMHVFSWY